MKLAAAGVLVLVVSACTNDPQCPFDKTPAYVQGRGGGYVCVPRPAEPVDGPSGASSSPASGQPPTDVGTSPPSPASAAGCQTIPTRGSEVTLVPKDAPTAVAGLVDAAPPNLTYALVQASFYAGDGGAAPGFQTLRASLAVAGAKLVLGFITMAAGPLESFTLTFASGALTEVCASQPGPIAAAVLPGGDGSTRPARLMWNERTAVLTLLVMAPAGDFEFLFTPA